MDDNGLSRLRAGDHAAWRKLNCTYRPGFISWARYAYGITAHEAKDAFQETLIVFDQRLRSGKIRTLSEDLTTLLFDIGKKKIVDMLRARTRRNKRCFCLPLKDLIALETFSAPDETEDPGPGLIRACFETLTSCEKRFLLLCLDDDLDMNDVAAGSGLSNAAVARQRKFKILRKLEKRFIIMKEAMADKLSGH
jgi:DNA-directed RNA polymerase specialized sigma24 family protein